MNVRRLERIRITSKVIKREDETRIATENILKIIYKLKYIFDKR